MLQRRVEEGSEMATYSVKRSVEASPEVLWELLTDAFVYPDWNPGVLGIEGTIGG